MKKLSAGSFQFSPSDLTTFLESPFSAWMDRYSLERPEEFERDGEDAAAELIQAKGHEHEARVLETLRTRYGHVETIPSKGDFEQRHQTTLRAMSLGHPVIYQAALKAEPFAGYADFLIRVPGTSTLGDYHYEAWDSKLSRSAKPSHLIQLLAYSEMLSVAQGTYPRSMTVVLGTGVEDINRTQDFRYYFENVKRQYLEFHRTFDSSAQPIPGKGEEIRRWSDEAAAVIERTDHLSQVAGIRKTDIKRLEAAGLRTLAALGTTRLKKIPDVEPRTFEKLKRQARLQVESKGLERPKYEVLYHGKDRVGLRLLPPRSALDVYFDMEGYPLFPDGGLEYLFGAVYKETNTSPGAPPSFIDFWAHDRVAEKRAFEGFIDWAYARFRADPRMHIYHYAAYEVTAMQKLSTRHATREFEVDELLRNSVFVDLLKVVTQGLAVGEVSYSIKKIEKLFGQVRGGEVTNATDSIVEYANYLESPDGADYHSSPTLKNIRDYNEVDCVSTVKLCDWLRNVQTERGLAFLAPHEAGSDGPKEETVQSPAALLAQGMLRELEGKGTLTEDERVQKVLAELLEFHRREAKQFWWKHFAWMGRSHEELIEDSECLGNLQISSKKPEPLKKSLVQEYSFDPAQDVKFDAGSTAYAMVDYETKVSVEVLEIDRDAGVIRLKATPAKLEATNGFPKVTSLLPAGLVDSKTIANSIYEVAKRFHETKTVTQSPGALPSALADFLFRKNPRIKGHEPGAPLVRAGADPLEPTIDLISRMEGTSLCIQGPPGAGKTYTGARVILALLKAGKRVGVASNSHHAVENLMSAVVKAARKEKFPVKGYKPKAAGADDAFFEETGIEEIKSSDIADLAAGIGGHYFVGGTAWGFSRDDAEGRLDYLFVDEAGQVCLANLVGMSRAATNLVLMGDQRQLEQPIQGSHPGESGESSLNYLIQEQVTIPLELGLFLEKTFRMRPEVCEFVSNQFYESRLGSDESTKSNVLIPGKKSALIKKDHGLLFLPVEHEDCSQSSPEEVDLISKLIKELLASEISENGKGRKLTAKDILVVAPYNLQVRLLRQHLAKDLEIGSVDKFQGREAAVVILSMCASNLEGAPRGVDFLFNPNRLNVAISRAKCLAIVIGNPRLADTQASSIAAMVLVNTFCGIKS